MFDKIIAYSIQNKFVIGLMVVALIIWGLFSLQHLPIDAVPDITNNQVQIITVSPTLATQEIEQFITSPVELSLQNIQQLEEIRSISKFGLSVVTVVFDEDMDIYLARQLVSEHLKLAQENIPEGLGVPEMSPISTGLGEIYQYVVFAKEGFEHKYSLSEIRSIQDWIVKRQLSGIEGVVEINTLGGFLKEYEVAVDPEHLKALNINFSELYEALSLSNENTGGAYIEKMPNTYYIRTNGIVKSLEDIENIVIKTVNGNPILIKDAAVVQFGEAPRYGALTRNGQEAVGGTVMMLKGSNSKEVIRLIKERMVQIEQNLPEGIAIDVYLDRDKLVGTAMNTVVKNLVEGGLIVIFILMLMLGNWRAGLIVASVIPLSMLFAIGMMKQFGISANLMSLGAIDFGLIVDGAVIIVEAIIHKLHIRKGGKTLTQKEMNSEVLDASLKIRSSAAFGEIIILMVYIPILALVGIEGKMFKPMAQTVMLAITGALILSLTYVPMMSALFLSKYISTKETWADKIITFFQKIYQPVLEKAFRFKKTFVAATLALLLVSLVVFNKLGGEFIPVLEEGDLALHQILPPGSSLSQSIEISKLIQHKLLAAFPEVEEVVTKIGAAEIPTDPMPIETGDVMVIMKPKSEWTSASTKQEMFEKMEKTLRTIPGMNYEFSQPIQMRFNELMTGSRADIAVKIYGEDLNILAQKGKEAEEIINKIKNTSSVKLDQTLGMPQIVVNYNYAKLAQFGLHVKEVNDIIKTAFAGKKAGTVYEGNKTFDLVLRMNKAFRTDISSVENLYISLPNGNQIPLTEVAVVSFEDAPMQIARDDTKRRVVIGVNVGDTDVSSLVNEIKTALNKEIQLPSGYYFTYGGQFENLEAANKRLLVAVPLALALIFVLLYFTFKSLAQAALIFTAIPLSAIGGIWALQLRGLPFSISAGIGFIALFGVAVLNGIVLIAYFNELKKEGISNVLERIKIGTNVRLRPVLMTAAVASLGFLPMALSNSGGAEVQRPLATVVIGGLISATFLTLVILPILYYWLETWTAKKRNIKASLAIILCITFMGNLNAQTETISLEEAINLALDNNLKLKANQLNVVNNQNLNNLKYSLGITSFFYQGDGLFTENPQYVNQFGVQQNFPSFADRKAKNTVQQQTTELVSLKAGISQQNIVKEISDTYFDLQYKLKINNLYKNLASTYEVFYEKAIKRQELGETNALEALNLKAQLSENVLLKKQTELEIKSLELALQNLINTNTKYTANEIFEPIAFVANTNENSLFIAAAKQNVALESAKVKLLKSEFVPSFNVGYAAQNYFESGWLHALEFGMDFNFFNSETKRNVAAQKVAVDIANLSFEAEQNAYKLKLKESENAIFIYKEGVNHFKEQVENINPEMIRITQLNYDAGQLSYLELLNTLNLLASQNKKYLDQILAYNKAINYYQFLISNK